MAEKKKKKKRDPNKSDFARLITGAPKPPNELQEAGKEALDVIGDAVYWSNEQLGPLSYINPLTIFEDSPEAQSVRQGLSYGWSDELAGLIAGEEEGERARKEAGRFREERPVASLVGETAGAFAAPGGYLKGGIGPLLAAKRYAPWAAGAGGALYGFGVGDDLEERKRLAAITGLASFGLGALLQRPFGNLAQHKYQKEVGDILPGADLQKDIFVDPASLSDPLFYHTTTADSAKDIIEHGFSARRGPLEQSVGGNPRSLFFFAPRDRAWHFRQVVGSGQNRGKPLETLEIDATQIPAGRLMLDRWNVPRNEGFFGVQLPGEKFTANTKEHPYLAHKTYQVLGDIPPSAIRRVVPEGEVAAMKRSDAAALYDRTNLNALHRAKRTATDLGPGPSKAHPDIPPSIRTLSPDDAVKRLRGLVKSGELNPEDISRMGSFSTSNETAWLLSEEGVKMADDWLQPAIKSFQKQKAFEDALLSKAQRGEKLTADEEIIVRALKTQEPLPPDVQKDVDAFVNGLYPESLGRYLGPEDRLDYEEVFDEAGKLLGYKKLTQQAAKPK